MPCSIDIKIFDRHHVLADQLGVLLLLCDDNSAEFAMKLFPAIVEELRRQNLVGDDNRLSVHGEHFLKETLL